MASAVFLASLCIFGNPASFLIELGQDFSASIQFVIHQKITNKICEKKKANCQLDLNVLKTISFNKITNYSYKVDIAL